MSDGDSQTNPFEDGSATAALRGLSAFEEALARMLHTAEHGRPLGIVRGPAGVGKSALLECIAGEIREHVRIDLRRSSAEEFALQLGEELGHLAPEAHLRWRVIEDAILGRAHASRPTLVLLDHLEAADTGLIRQVERLLALAEASAGWCSLLAAGRTRVPAVDALARRHGELRIELGPLSRDETEQFLQNIVTTSGCPPLTSEAAAAIHACTGGLLRDILRLGRLALFARSVDETPQVTAETVRMVAGELMLPETGHLPERPLPSVAPEATGLITARV